MNDDETQRECRVCRTYVSYSSRHCHHCGAPMTRASGEAPLLERLVREATLQLTDLGLDEHGLELHAGLSECLVALVAWREGRVPSNEERGRVTDRAIALAMAAGAYAAGRRK